ncbi:hypothetical protein HFP89_14500 [Wenzhouxiangella sp. XN79A]|uniref:hypothetical protein n=1 Tax=Wenzhouxiangella sp. XN79A TaxID=2724193 RepID=UPI00144A5E08|nr:hypothetical protein [Wenzhouxiangella sp. XN79A]NKI36378.1 hypothetical protein [Wenzhouxiangella sp. XN79A]
MILRRVTEHVKAQNWFAVGIDFFIVIAGVFIGIQVANWNDARRDRDAEALYLDRLHRELSTISPLVEQDHKDQRDRLERLDEVRMFLATGLGIERLDGRHCGALSQSHIFADTIFYPATIKELIATGRIVLIRDDATRTEILSFDQNNERLEQIRTDIQIDRVLLARKYPQLIIAGLGEWEDAICDFEAMSLNQSYLNDFIDNMRRYAAYVSNVTGRQSEVIESLRGTIASASIATYASEASSSSAPVASEVK